MAAALAVLLVICIAAPRAARAEAPTRPASRVLLISLDGFYPEIYRRARELGVRIPNLERLVRDGTSADGMLGIFPSTTYPSHTTLITGVRPAEHGVVTNSIFAPGGPELWYWFADSLRAPTLPEKVHAAGRVVAVSCWPALVGARWVDWHLPEIWSLGANDETSRRKMDRWATPGLVKAVEARFGAWTDERFEWGKQDDRITDGAVYLIEAKRPHLLLVHLVEVDHVLHEQGRNAKPALRAFETADRQIGRMLTALDRAGLRDSTNVVVVGDHGFANVHTDFRPNVVLATAGLLQPGGPEAGDWRAVARTNTCTAGILLHDPTDRDAAAVARRAFETLASGAHAGVFDILDRATLDAYGAYPGAAFGLVCRPGYSFSGRASGDLLIASRSRGMHGYVPEDPAMHAGFVAAGPDFAPGQVVPLVRMLDVAPTLAQILGVDLGPQVRGIAVPGLRRREGAP